MDAHQPLSSTERSRRRREALRARGLRPKTAWLPDPAAPEVKKEVKQALDRWWSLADDEEQALRFAELMTDDVLADLPPPWAGDR